jgi:hypothetical protein
LLLLVGSKVPTSRFYGSRTTCLVGNFGPLYGSLLKFQLEFRLIAGILSLRVTQLIKTTQQTNMCALFTTRSVERNVLSLGLSLDYYSFSGLGAHASKCSATFRTKVDDRNLIHTLQSFSSASIKPLNSVVYTLHALDMKGNHVMGTYAAYDYGGQPLPQSITVLTLVKDLLQCNQVAYVLELCVTE